MNFKELHEGAEPKMPGAPKGISIMTPQQFVASAGDMPEEEGVAEGENLLKNQPPTSKFYVTGDDGKTKLIHCHTKYDARVAFERRYPDIKITDIRQKGESKTGVAEGDKKPYPKTWHDVDPKLGKQVDKMSQAEKVKKGLAHPDTLKKSKEQGVAEGKEDKIKKLQQDYADKLRWSKEAHDPAQQRQHRMGAGTIANHLKKQYGVDVKQGVAEGETSTPAIYVKGGGKYPGVTMAPRGWSRITDIKDEGDSYFVMVGNDGSGWNFLKDKVSPHQIKLKNGMPITAKQAFMMFNGWTPDREQGVAEGQEQLDRIRSLSGLGEATKLPAQTRDLDSQEFQDYMKRIVGTPDLDKAGNVKVDKKGNEKYTTGKTAGDKYKMPYIHRSSVVSYLSPDGKSYDEDAVKKTLSIRPKALLKQNEKMKHSNGEFEQFFNVGFAALVGIALDEQTNNLIVVNTCPGAGSCKVDCFAMKGGKIQFKAAWQSDGRILTYLLNDPDGFFNQLSNEISVESQAAAKGDKKFPNGWQVTVRWHDAGDFFSPEYLDMALKMAAKHPDVRFYAYTKMAGAALAQKPDNFIINWSEGANTAQEKQVKAKDPNLDTTKNSRIVPEKLFYDLLAKDEKGNLKKTDDGAWQPASPEALAEMKQRIAKEYGISVSSILSYTEYMAKRNSIPAGMKYNVIVAPGEGDVSANDPGVLSTLLLRH